MSKGTSWKVEYAKSGQSTCKYPSCKRKIAKNEVRVGITQRGAGGGGGSWGGQSASYARFAASTQWFHVECCATKLKRAKSLRRPESASQLKGFDELDPGDKQKLCQALGMGNDMPGGDSGGAGGGGSQLARALSSGHRPAGGGASGGWTQKPRAQVPGRAGADGGGSARPAFERPEASAQFPADFRAQAAAALGRSPSSSADSQPRARRRAFPGAV